MPSTFFLADDADAREDSSAIAFTNASMAAAQSRLPNSFRSSECAKTWRASMETALSTREVGGD